MTASELCRKIEAAGGRFELRDRKLFIHWQKHDSTLARMASVDVYCLTAWILEREASLRWEKSGKDPNWWRNAEK